MTRRKLKKFAEIKEMKNIFEEDGKEMKGKWNSSFFGNDGAIVLELGCGGGDYVLALSERFCDCNLIGIDRKGDRVWMGAKKALDLNRRNCAFLKIYIEDLCEYFGDEEVDEIWITFPDPYPKPSKSGRRLVSPRFLEIYKRVLKPDGIVHLKTDHLPLFEFGIESARESGWEVLKEIRDLYGQSSNIDRGDMDVQTFYEKRFMEEGKEIYYLQMREAGNHL